MDNTSVIVVEKLCRDYIVTNGVFHRKRTIVKAVKDLNFTVQKGEVFGLVGQNGAGKTTTIKMLITMLAPTSGTCKVLGYNSFGEEKKIRSRINFIFGGEYGLYRRLSARDNLRYFSNLYKIPIDTREKRINELLEMIGLADKADLRVETYSKGMAQRVQIARGLLNEPEILFMDEPSIGLDPLGAKMLRDIVKEANKNGITILLTSHNMYEIDELCNRVAIIKDGEMVAIGTPDAIKESIPGGSMAIIKLSAIPDAVTAKIASINGVISVDSDDKENTLTIIHDLGDSAISKIIPAVGESGILSFSNNNVTLEDAYIHLVQSSEQKENSK